MAVAAQALPILSAGVAETELHWWITTDEQEFRNRPRREGEVAVLDRSALIEEKLNRRATFLAAQLEGQKIYKK